MDGRVAWPCGMIQRIQSFKAELMVIFTSANDIKQIFGLGLGLGFGFGFGFGFGYGIGFGLSLIPIG